jgi:hypothetical protein
MCVCVSTPIKYLGVAVCTPWGGSYSDNWGLRVGTIICLTTKQSNFFQDTERSCDDILPMERSFLVASDDDDEEDAASLPSLIVQAVITDLKSDGSISYEMRFCDGLPPCKNSTAAFPSLFMTIAALHRAAELVVMKLDAAIALNDVAKLKEAIDNAKRTNGIIPHYNALTDNGLVVVSLTQRCGLESGSQRFILLSRCTTVRVYDTTCDGLLNKIA